MRRRGERGVGTVLTAGVCAVLLVVAWVASVLVSWIGQVTSAQDAADLASLAAAGAVARGADPCGAAKETATRNRVELTGCTVRGDRWSFVVDVRVRCALEPAVPGGPGHVERAASAGTLQ